MKGIFCPCSSFSASVSFVSCALGNVNIFLQQFLQLRTFQIWLKDAYQCGECGVICHKKCMGRCEQETTCDPGGLKYKDPPKSDNQDSREHKEAPEIITTIAVGAENGSPKNTPPVSPQVGYVYMKYIHLWRSHT